MNPIEMLLDEENELTFQVNIEGNRPADASCRLRLDNESVGLMFEANKNQDGEITVVIPPLKHVLKEGIYDMSLEVIVDDKYFQPLTIQGSFENSLKVTAEAVVRRKNTKTSVSANTMVESRKVSKPTVVVKNSSVKNNSKDIQLKKKLTEADIKNLITTIVRNNKK
jgi:hypothetical protein